jgi:hypothetical protein
MAQAVRFRAGTVAALLADGAPALLGITAPTPAGIATLRAVKLGPGEGGDRETLTLELTVGGEAIVASGRYDTEDSLISDSEGDAWSGLDVPCIPAGEVAARVQAALPQVVAQLEPGPLVNALLTPIEAGSLASWIPEHGAAFLRGGRAEDEPVAEAAAGRQIVRYSLRAVRLEGSAVKLELRQATHRKRDGALVDLKEQEIYSGGIRRKARELRGPPADDAEVAQIAAYWRRCLQHALEEALELAPPESLMPHEVYPRMLDIWRYLFVHLESGPRQARPLALSWTPEQLASAVKSLGPARKAGKPQRGAVRLGDWTISVSKRAVLAGVESTAVLIAKGKQRPSLAFATHVDLDAHADLVDGDAATARAVHAFLRACLEQGRAGRPLAGALQALAHAHWPWEPFDWRVEGDVFDFADWGPAPGRVKRDYLRDPERYHAFIREVMSPELAAMTQPSQAPAQLSEQALLEHIMSSKGGAQ